MILFFRILADFCWNYKAVATVLNVLVIVFFIKKLLTNKIDTKVITVYNVLGIILGLLIFSFALKVNETTLKIFIKIFVSIILFVYGCYATDIFKSSQKILLLSIGIICFELLFSVLGLGYKDWGAVRTFTGFYFFKTDLALSMVISMSYVLYFYDKNIKIKIALILISFYLVFISNARIHLLTSIMLVLMYLVQSYILTKPTRAILTISTVSLGFVVVFSLLLYLTNIAGDNFLSLDVKDPFGGGNTQGRDKIWEVIIEKFNKADFVDQFLGLGLSFDSDVNQKFSETGDGNNSHNGYLFMMVSIGYLGLSLFLLYISMIYRRFVFLSKKFFDVQRTTLLMLFLSHTMIFLVSNISNVNLMFQQQTWFFFYFAGVLYNRKYFQTRF